MLKIERNVKIKNPQGLHARPAVLFVQIANKYNSNVTIQNGEDRVNGKSIMGILTLGISKGTTVKLVCEGEDAEPLIVELEELLNKDNIDEQ